MTSKGTEAGPGWPAFIEEKPVGYYDKPCSIWQRLPYQSQTGGVSPMWLEGREGYMVERMRGMTPERRAHRKQFLKDQILSPREPVFVPELYRELNNPIRRFYKAPFDKLYNYLKPIIGDDFARYYRRMARNYLLAISGVYVATYLGLFYFNDWKQLKRGKFHRNKPVVFPGDPDYPYTSTKTKPEDYYDFGFKKSIFYKSEEQVRADYEAELRANELRDSRMLRK